MCRGLDAEDGGTLTQRDTYFVVPRGWLKLREEAGAEAHLIAYERPDLAGKRESRYRIVAVPDPEEMREALASVLGVRIVVAKERRLFLREGVRIHLDRVDDLGDFIEFEGVAEGEEDLGRFEALLADLRMAFAIKDADLLAASYSDLLEVTGD